MLSFRFTLFKRILLWFFVNLAVLCLVLFGLFNLQFQLDHASPLRGPSSTRLELMASQIALAAGGDSSRAERDALLAGYSQNYGAEFLLFANDGRQMGGREVVLPPAVNEELHKSGRPRPPRDAPPPPNDNLPPDGVRPPPPRQPPPPRPFDIVKAVHPTLPFKYWALVRVPLLESGAPRAIPSTVVVASDSMTGHGLFFDPLPWAIMAAVIIVLSTLLWLPFARHLTKAIGKLTAATEQIADGRFDVRVDEQRSDEIGRLGTAINHLAARLSGYVSGQKRFLGDISHELCSPLARMEFAVSILEQRAAPNQQDYIVDVQEELRQMSALVSELLSFSKAGIQPAAVQLEPVALRALAQQVVEREGAAELVEVMIDDHLAALAQRELLARALANVIRNAVRYAAESESVMVTAAQLDNHVRLKITDAGPGVPEEELDKIFDPFYRLEPDRARNTGGVGLGLTIVKSCIEACQGTVSAHNVLPRGLEIVITLKAAH